MNDTIKHREKSTVMTDNDGIKSPLILQGEIVKHYVFT